MDVFSSSCSISRGPMMQSNGVGSNNTSATAGAVSGIPPQYPGRGAYMQQQQQQQPYYYNYIPTLPPAPPAPPSNYMNRGIATYYAPMNNIGVQYSYPPPPPPPPSFMLVTPLREKIAKQIDFYFCDDNLAKDVYLRERMDEEGWVPITLITSFRRISELKMDAKFVLDSLIYSANVEVKGDRIRRRGAWKKWLLPKRQES